MSSARDIPLPIILLIWLLLIIFVPGMHGDWGWFLTVTLLYVAWMTVKIVRSSRRQNKESTLPYYQPPHPMPERDQPSALSLYEQQKSAPQYPPSSSDEPPSQDG